MPFIPLFIYFSFPSDCDILAMNLKECKDEDEIYRHIRTFLNVVDLRHKDKNKMIALEGFSYHHEVYCEIPACPIRKYIDDKDDENKAEGKESQKYLYSMANAMFLNGITQAPNNSNLRIFYGIFLWERMQNKNSALQEFFTAESLNPPIDQQFIIYRYRKIIYDKEESKNYKGETLDVVSGIAYESHFKQCFLNVTKAADLYFEFWENLSAVNNTPDIAKLNELGMSINNINNSIEMHWANMQKLKPNDPKALKLYFSYNLNVLNNIERGNDLMQLWRETIDKKISTISSGIGVELENIESSEVREGHGFLLIRSDEENYGEIVKSTLNVTKMLNYTKKELVGKDFKMLFEDFHLDFLSKLLQTPRKQSVKLIGRTKCSSCIPLKVSVRIYDKEQKIVLMNIRKVEKDTVRHSRSCYFVVDEGMTIRNCSLEGHDLLLRLGIGYMKSKSCNFFKEFPLFSLYCRDLDGFDSEEILESLVDIGEMNYNYKRDIDGFGENSYHLTFQFNDVSKTSKEDRLMLIHANYYTDTTNSNAAVCYYMAFEQVFVVPKLNFEKKKKTVTCIVTENNPIKSVEQSYKPAEKADLEEYKEELDHFLEGYKYNSNEEQANMEESSSQDSEEELEDTFAKKNKEMSSAQALLNDPSLDKLGADELRLKISQLEDFSEGLLFKVIKRDGKLENVYNFVGKLVNLRREVAATTDDEDFNNSSQKEIKKKDMSHKFRLSSVESLGKLKCVAFIVFLSLTGFVVYDFFIAQEYESKIDKTVVYLKKSVDLDEKLSQAGFVLNNLVEVSGKGEDELEGKSQEEYLQHYSEKLKEIELELSGLYRDLSNSKISMSEGHLALLTDKSIDMVRLSATMETRTESSSLLTAIKSQIGAVIYLSPQIDISFRKTPLVVEFSWNNSASFGDAMMENIEMFYSLLKSNEDSAVLVSLINIGLSFLVSVASISLLFFYLTKVENERTDILKSFYTIPKFYIKYLSDKTAQYLSKIQKGDKMNDETDSNEMQLNTMDIAEIEKNYGNSYERSHGVVQLKQNSRMYLVRLIIPLLSLTVYTVLIYWMTDRLNNSIDEVKELTKSTNYGYKKLTFTHNLLSQERFTKAEVAAEIDNLRLMLDKIHLNVRYKRESLLGNSFKADFNALMFEQACFGVVLEGGCGSDKVNNFDLVWC